MKDIFKAVESYRKELNGEGKMKPLSHKERQKRKRKRRMNKRK